MREIITLQLGQRANYLLTHFWNIQESYFTYDEGKEALVDHDIHFRSGIGADGTETYTPRVLIYDLKGAFGTLRRNNALYELSEDLLPGQGLWDGEEVIQQQPRISKNEYQESLDRDLPAPPLTPETVRYWSDYNRIFYHPRSMVQINDYELCSATMPFEDWNTGEELFSNIDREQDLFDRDVRPFAEECDQLRAIQIFTGSDDAWAGFAARYIDRLRDEFGRKSIWTWALEGGAKLQRKHQAKRDLNKAKSIYHISTQSSVYTPIIDPPPRIPSLFHVDRRSEWQTSALITFALETATLPSRLCAFNDFEAALIGDGVHKIFELQSTVVQDKPSAKDQQSRHEDTTKSVPWIPSDEFNFDFSYDDRGRKDSHIFNQVQVARGISSEQADGLASADSEALMRRQRWYSSESVTQSFRTTLRFPLLDSFPCHMLSGSRQGETVSVYATLTSSSRTSDAVKNILGAAARTTSIDERETLNNGLGEIRETYEIGGSFESDVDDD